MDNVENKIISYQMKNYPQNLIEPETNKVYGQSVVGNISNVVADNNTDFFPEDALTDDLLNKARNELKSDNVGSVKEIIKTDAINGVKNSTVDDDEFKKIIDIINEQDIRGKTITSSGKAMIEDLLKSKPTEEELKHISEKFDEIMSENKNFNDVDFKCVKEALNERIVNKIMEMTSEDDFEAVTRRFGSQLFNTYQKVVQYNDDVKQLSLIVKKVNDYNKSSETQYNSEEEFEKFNNEFKNLTDVQNNIMEFMNKVSKLDDRNKRLRQDYTIDDYDIRTVESVKKCLDSALDFEKVKLKVQINYKKFKKDFKDDKIINSSIENWINDIRNDPDTLFTFPVNDFLSLEESRIQMENYLYNNILYANLPDNILDAESDDLGEEMIKHGIVKREYINKFKTEARLLLYVLSRTFKHKKLVTDDDRRILSYTLDIISKMSIRDHCDRVVNLAEYIYNKILG